jgi:hypothetical protein
MATSTYPHKAFPVGDRIRVEKFEPASPGQIFEGERFAL